MIENARLIAPEPPIEIASQAPQALCSSWHSTRVENEGSPGVQDVQSLLKAVQAVQAVGLLEVQLLFRS